MGLVIVIVPHGPYAIYEQIVNQIKNQIISGELQPDEALPSIRGLAADIGVSVITTKRAYEELEREGLIRSVSNKGFYVCKYNTDYLHEKQLMELEKRLQEWITLAKQAGLGTEDITLYPGEIHALLGENGAGKTTFFRYIMEEKKHYRGSFYLDGTDIAENHVWSMNRIGFVSEERLFLRQKSARENARLLGSFYDTFDMDRFAALMEQMDLTMARTVEQMSRGENVKFQLAFALAHKPRLLLLDEPTAGMDPIFRKEFYRLLRQQLEVLDCSVIMSSHLEDDIRKEFDYIGRFEHGEFTSFYENA